MGLGHNEPSVRGRRGEVSVGKRKGNSGANGGLSHVSTEATCRCSLMHGCGAGEVVERSLGMDGHPGQ